MVSRPASCWRATMSGPPSWSAKARRRAISSASACQLMTASCVQDRDGLSFDDRVAFRDENLGHRSCTLDHNRNFHIHGFDQHDRIALGDFLADRSLDLPDRAADL